MPRPKAECQEAAGNFSTGIIDAQSTSDRRKIEPLTVSGSTSQSGRRTTTESRIATHTATPMKWKMGRERGEL